MLKQAKLSNKCQITVPKQVRDILGIGKGDDIMFYIENDEVKLTGARNNEEKAFKKVYDKEFENKAIQRYEQNSELFKILFTDEEFMNDIKSALFRVVYNKLKE